MLLKNWKIISFSNQQNPSDHPFQLFCYRVLSHLFIDFMLADLIRYNIKFWKYCLEFHIFSLIRFKLKFQAFRIYKTYTFRDIACQSSCWERNSCCWKKWIKSTSFKFYTPIDNFQMALYYLKITSDFRFILKCSSQKNSIFMIYTFPFK